MGMKQSDPMLPKGWRSARIKDIAPLQRGFDLPNRMLKEGATPVVYSNGIERHHNQAMARGPGVVTGRSGTLGKVHYVDSDYWPHNTALWVTDFKGNHPKYIYYLYVAIDFEQFASGSGVPTLNRNDAHSYEVALPIKHDEQSAIAEALSDVDGLIGGLERLIAKKRAVKKAAMQQLLTGKTRLPGFSGEWRLMKFSDLTSPSHNRIDPSRVEPCNFCVELEHIGQGTGRLLAWSSTTPHSSIKAVFEPGDVLFGKLRAYLRKYWTADRPGVCSTEIWVLKPNLENVVSSYLYQLVTTNWFINAASTAYGTHMPRSDWKVVRELEFKIPPSTEQEAIVKVLGDMDAEIAALEHRRDKTRQIKQGMMQQLLTGRVRLVDTGAQTDSDGKASKSHSWAFNEAVVISALTKHFGKGDFPLGRKRYTKLSYLLHRHTDQQAEGYLKKAAGPYNPRTKYGGPERIALESGYIREHKNGPYTGFVAADNIAQAEGYFERWYGADAIQWLNQFRFKKNDDLELLATVDMAAEELRAEGQAVDVKAVKAVIRSHPEWKAKLDRTIFSDKNIAKAIEASRDLFTVTEQDNIPGGT